MICIYELYRVFFCYLFSFKTIIYKQLSMDEVKHMTDNELLLAISDIVSKNSKSLEQRLSKRIDDVEESLSRKIDEVDERLSRKIDEVDERLSRKIDEVDHRLSTEVHNILLRMENNIEPRLDQIEACYISTYKRYQDGVEKMDTLEMNMEVVQSVVKEHSEKLNAMIA